MPKSATSKKNSSTKSARTQKKHTLLWILMASGVIVATAILFFTLQKTEQEQSLAAVEAQAAKARIVAPCKATAEENGVKAQDVVETFKENIRERKVWELQGTDLRNTRTANGELVFEVNNANKGFNNAYVLYTRDLVGDVSVQTVAERMKYEGVRAGDGDAYGQLHIKFFDKERHLRSESVLRFRIVKDDTKKWEAEMLFRNEPVTNDKWEQLGKKEFSIDTPLKLRFTRKGNELYGMVKNADQGETPMSILGSKKIPKNQYALTFLALDSVRDDNDPAQRLQVRYRNYRVFCPGELPVEADSAADLD